MMFIDYPDGSVGMPFTQNVLEAAEMAKEAHGRLRLVVDNGMMSTSDPMVGCVQLLDAREKASPDCGAEHNLDQRGS